MSEPEAVRAAALDAAIRLAGGKYDIPTILNIADAFLGFLQGGATSPALRSMAGAEPAPQKEGKPSANTAVKKAAKAVAEQAAAKEALAKAEAEAPAEEAVGPAGAFEATKEGISAAVAAMISNKTGEGPNRDTAISLLKKYKAASVSAMQAKDEKTVSAFIDEVNTAFGLGGEPDLEG